MPTAPPRTRCPGVEPAAPGAQQHFWTLLSRHTTSGGGVQYCRCACGVMAVICDGVLLAFVMKSGASTVDLHRS